MTFLTLAMLSSALVFSYRGSGTEVSFPNYIGEYSYTGSAHTVSNFNFEDYYAYTFLVNDLSSQYVASDLGYRIFSMGYNDTANGVYYDRLINCYISEDNNTWTLSLLLNDYDTDFDRRPFLNYNFYLSFTYVDDMTGPEYVYSVKSTSMTPLYEAERDIYFELPNFEENYSFSLVMYFKQIDSISWDYIVRGYEAYYDMDSSDYNFGYSNGYYDGYNDAVGVNYNEGYDTGYTEGYTLGVSTGREQAIDQGQTASVIFNGIISIGVLPVNVFLKILNFEVFGINIGAFVSSLLTIMVIITIIRTFMGGKGAD